MTTADKAPAVSGQRPVDLLPVDLLIVGGGVMGLWAAVTAARAGLDTMIVERQRPGAGASGGLLGALMPHSPERWNDKKQFQFEALVSLEADIAALENETGLKAGYRRSGRVIPLLKSHQRDIALKNAEDAGLRWKTDTQAFAWDVLDATVAPGWPDASACVSGIVHETLSARVSPRALLNVLEAAARASGRVRIVEGVEVESLDAGAGVATLSAGGDLAFGHAVMAAGVQSFPLLDAVLESGSPSGMAVKGQAALLRACIDPASPIIFLDGLYIVPHEDGSVAIGSTSENAFDDPFSTDERLDALIDAACTLAPALAGAPVIERWAGLRPKAIGRDPMVGRLPGHPRIIALTGGFKVSFGVAHRLAKAAIADVVGEGDIGVPVSFRAATHIDLAAKKGPA